MIHCVVAGLVFTGTILTAERVLAAESANLQIRPSAGAARIELQSAPVIDGDLSDPAWQSATVDLPQGKVDIHVFSVESVVNFTPDMQLAVQAQFDNISEDFALLARYRWEYQPGSELFVALGQSAVLPMSRFVAQTTQFSVRLGHTFRF